MRRVLRACGRATLRYLASEHAWMASWVWIGYPPPVLWVVRREPWPSHDGTDAGTAG